MGGYSNQRPVGSWPPDGTVVVQSPEDVQRYAPVQTVNPMDDAWDDWARQMDDFTSRIGPPGHESAVYAADPPPPPEPVPDLSTWGGDAVKGGLGLAAQAVADKGAGALFEGAPAWVGFGAKQLARRLVPNGRTDLDRDWNIFQAWQLYNSARTFNNGLKTAEAIDGISHRHDFD
jgi:hypothetical protein